MSFDLAPILGELGTPTAVFLLGLIIYFKEKKSPGTDAGDLPAEFKLWMGDHIRDPILRAIQDKK